MKTGSIDIRRAGQADAQSVADIHDEAWHGAYRGMISGLTLERMISRRGVNWWRRAIRGNSEILVLEVCGVTAGYVTMGPSRMQNLPFRGEIYELYLRPEYQGLGFGRALFEGAQSQMARFGMSSHAVRVLTENEPACLFYEAMGGDKVRQSNERVGEDLLPISIYGWP